MTIDEQRAQYLAQLRAELDAHQCRRLYIYGAAFNANRLYLLLRDHGLTADAFVVTDPSANRPALLGVPVIGLDAVPADDHALFVLGLRPIFNDEVAALLAQRGHRHLVLAPGNLTTLLDATDGYSRPMFEISAKIGCEIDCRYCPQSLLLSRYFANDPRRRAMLPLDDFKRYLDKSPANAVVTFAGFAEPLLNPQLPDMIRYAHGSRRPVNLFSTFHRCAPSTLRQLADIPFNMVILHLPDKDGFAKIPLTPDYFRTLDALMAMTKPSGSPFIDGANAQTEPHPDVLPHIFGKVTVHSAMTDRAGNLRDDTLWQQHGVRGPIRCCASQNLDRFVLLPDGSLVLCCNDYGLRHLVGDLNTQTWDEIMRGEPLAEIRRRLADESRGYVLCRDCVRAVPAANHQKGA